jgi:hypothetical protein
MPDQRPAHMRVSLLNQPTEPFRGAATALYTERGPQRSHNTGRQEPQSLADHVDMALDRVKGLGPKQKLAVHNEICRMLRDIEVIRLIHESTKGPYGDQAAGVPMDQGRPL